MKVRKLDTDGDIAIPGEWIDGNEATAQRVGIRLRLFTGEWFADTQVGIPYFQDILAKKNPDLPLIRSLFVRAILTTPGILNVDCDVSLDAATRTLSVDWSATTTDNSTAEGRENFVL